MRRSAVHRAFVFAVGCLLVASVCPVQAGEPVKNERLSADFQMERSLSALNEKLHSSGRLMLGGPGLLRWETERPARSVLVVNGGKARIQYPDLGVTRSFDFSTDPVMRVLSEHLLAITGGDLAKAAEFYRIEPLGGEGKRLLPRQQEIKDIFQEIRLTLDNRGVVLRVELISRGGDATVITFSNVRLDPALPPGTFRVGE